MTGPEELKRGAAFPENPAGPRSSSTASQEHGAGSSTLVSQLSFGLLCPSPQPQRLTPRESLGAWLGKGSYAAM